MKASKEDAGKNKKAELTGKVVVKKFGEGSKSEHDAVYLDTGERSYVLRKAGGNPFQDSSLHAWVGKTVTAKGIISNYLFLVTDINECT